MAQGMVTQISKNEIIDKVARKKIDELQKQVQALRMCILALARLARVINYTFEDRKPNTSLQDGYEEAKDEIGLDFNDIVYTAYQLCNQGGYHTTDINDITKDTPFKLRQDTYYAGRYISNFELFNIVNNYFNNFSLRGSTINIPTKDSNIF